MQTWSLWNLFLFLFFSSGHSNRIFIFICMKKKQSAMSTMTSSVASHSHGPRTRSCSSRVVSSTYWHQDADGPHGRPAIYVRQRMPAPIERSRRLDPCRVLGSRVTTHYVMILRHLSICQSSTRSTPPAMVTRLPPR